MIHLACFDITLLREGDDTRLYEAASPERRDRADRCRRREDALRCLAAEALLRWAGVRSGIPEDFAVKQEPGGKPYLPQWPDFHFNLSHSGRWVVLAWGDTPVGVDVEKMAPDGKTETLARRHFTAEEQAFLSEGPPERFYQIWTAKESYLKYLGTGLTRPLGSFCVLTMKSPRFFSWELEGGYSLTLCADENANLELLTRQQLIP